MLSTEQAEAASKALTQQKIRGPSQDDKEQSAGNRRRFEFIILGMVGGGVLSWVISGKTYPGLSVGLGVGALLGALLDARIRRMYLLTVLSLTLVAAIAWALLRA